MTDVSDAGLGRLARAVARQERMSDLLPELHQQAVRAAGGSTSVLLRFNPRSSDLIPSSAFGLDHLDYEPWMTTDEARAAAERVWKEAAPLIVSDVPELAERLSSRAAMLVPILARDDRLGLLVLGVDDIERAEAGRAALSAVADMVAVALERERLQREADLQQDLRALVADFSRAVSSSLHLAASLEIFCDRARRLFSADRVSVWSHDRRAHVIELIASSDAAEVAGRQRVPADDKSAPVAMVMRSTGAAMAPPPARGGPPSILVPLRGRRRALGTMVVDGVRFEPGDEFDLLERLEEVGRQLSVAIENLWLLEDVLRSRRELESTFNSLADLVVVCDAQARVTHSNQAFARRLRRESEEIIERPLAELVGPDLMQWVDQTVRREEPSTHFQTQEIEDAALGGTFIFTISPLVGREGDQIGMVIVARDVTDQARLEAERSELRDRLTQSEKLAALGQFVAGIAHELNNPLQGVLGHLELMLHAASQSPPRFKNDLKLVLKEADRAAKIVHNLLVFAGSRRISRRRLNVSLVVSRALALRAAACASAGIDVVKDLAQKLPRVAGDSLLLQQALLNIVINAEQALAGVEGPRRIDVRTSRVGPNLVRIDISDNGPGIPPDALPRLFEPFFTTKEVGKGTGLGLAIAYGIVQEHGGELRAVNRPEGGATFTLELPSGADAVE